MPNNFLLQQFYSINTHTLEWARGCYKKFATLYILKSNLKNWKFQKPKTTLILEKDEKIFFFVKYGIKLVIWMLTYGKIVWLMIHTVYIVAMNSRKCALFPWMPKIYSAKRYSLTAILWHWCPSSDKLYSKWQFIVFT